MTKVYMTADLHLRHKNILKYRKNFVKTLEEHDITLVENILRPAKKRDILYLLGDCFFDFKSLEYLSQFCEYFSKVYWILGNHDMQYCDINNSLQYLLTIHDNLEVHGFKKYKKAWLSHTPMYKKELRGKINIHGHVHNKTIHDYNYVNVSCDNTNFHAVNYQYIVAGYRGTLFNERNAKLNKLFDRFTL